MTKKIKLSIVASASLAAVLLMTGCDEISGGKSSDTTTISGSAIDGYVSGGTVAFSSGSSTTATTGTDGSYTIALPRSLYGSTSSYITVSGGTDVSTGEAFEGTITSLPPTTTATTTVYITPITTLTQSYASNGSFTKAAAESAISSLLGVSSSLINADPVAILSDSSNSNYAAAQTIMKSAVQIQKMVEVMSDAGVSDPSTEIAKKISAGSTSIDTAIESVVSDETIVSDSTKRTALSGVSSMLKSISTSSITSSTTLASVAKAVEAVTESVEASLISGDTTTAANAAKSAAVTGVTKLQEELESAGGTVSALKSIYQDSDTITAKAELYDAVASAVSSAGGSLDTVLAAIATSSDDVTTVLSNTVSGVDTTTVATKEATANEKRDSAVSKNGGTVTPSSITLAGKTLSIGTSNPMTTTLGSNGTYGTVTLSAGTSASYLFSMSISNITASKLLASTSISLSATLTNKNDTTDVVTMTVSGAKISASSTGAITLTLPVGTSVSITETAGSVDSSYSGTLASELTNTDLSVNFSSIVNALSSSTSIQSGLTKANTRLASTGNYTLALSISESSSSLAFDQTSFSGTVNVQ